MADPLSIAASIAGIISLTDTVFRYAFKYTRSVSGAQDDIRRLSDEINSFSAVLRSLHALACDLQAQGQEFDCALRVEYLSQCQHTFEKVKKRLKKASDDLEGSSKVKRVARQLKWPYSVSETKELLEDISRQKNAISLATSADTMRQLQLLLSQQSDRFDQIDNSLSKTSSKIEISTQILLNSEKKGVLDFFMPPSLNPQRNLDQSIKWRQPTTGTWLLESEELKQWYSTPGSHLWLKGIPGGGKTVLAGAVIQEALDRALTASKDIGVAFFFCDYKNETTHSPVNILGSIAYQIALQKDEAFELLKDHYEELHPKRSLSRPLDADELRATISRMSTQFEHVYIILDGVDECQDKVEGVATAVQDLADCTDNTSIALFSREEDEIEAALDEDFRQITISARTQDIETYIRAEMMLRESDGRLIVKDVSVKEKIEGELVGRAKGMFRWVACQLDYMSELWSDADRLEALDQLPESLHDSYFRILRKINKLPVKTQDMIRLCMRFLAFFPEPLTIEQLCQAISTPVTLGASLGQIVDQSSVARKCSSLIRKTADGQYFEFAHFTVQEFLSDAALVSLPEFASYRISKPDDGPILGLLCLKFVQLKNFEPNPFSSDKTYSLSFYPKAALRWPQLTANGLQSPELLHAAKSLFRPTKNNIFARWLRTFMTRLSLSMLSDKASDSGSYPLVVDFLKSCRPVHVAAALNLPEICSFLIQGGVNTSSSCSLGSPIELSLSSFLSHYDSCVEPEYHNRYVNEFAWLELTLPRPERRNATIACLRAAGARTNSTTEKMFLHSMLVSWKLEDFRSVADLLSNGLIPTEAEIDSFQDYLDRCWNKGRSSALLGSSLEAFNDYLSTSSLLDTKWGLKLGKLIWYTAVAMELPFTMDPSRTNSRISLSFDALKAQVNFSIADDNSHSLTACLDDGRVSVNEVGCWNLWSSESLLYNAIRRGAVNCTGMLLERGSDPYAEANEFPNAVQLSGFLESIELLDVLVQHRVSLLDVDENGFTIWHFAAQTVSRGSREYLDILFSAHFEDAQMGIRMKSALGETPLDVALKIAILPEDECVILELIAHCNDVPLFWESQGHIFPLAFALRSEKVIKLIMQYGLDLEDSGFNCAHPLHDLACGVSVDWVRFLKGLFPEDYMSRSGGRLPVETYVDNCIKGNDAPEEEILNELTFDGLFETVDEEGRDPWTFLCSAASRIGSENARKGWECFQRALTHYFLQGCLKSYEDNNGECGLHPFFSMLFQMHVDNSLPYSIVDSEVLNKEIGLSRYWRPYSELAVRFLRAAMAAFDIDSVRVLIRNSVPLNHPVDNLTILHFACRPTNALRLSSGPRGKDILELIFADQDSVSLNALSKASPNGGLIHDLAHSEWKKSNAHWILQCLVEKGLDIDAVNDAPLYTKRMTPLTWHLELKSLAMAEVLMDMGASLNGMDSSTPHNKRIRTLTPVHSCAVSGNVAWLRRISEASKRTGIPVLWEAPFRWNMESAGENHFDIMTGFQMACFKGHHECVNFFLEETGIDNQFSSPAGKTALHFAASHGDIVIIEQLIRHGFDVMAETLMKLTPLHYAVMQDNRAAVRTLIQFGAENSIDKYDRTPLSIAVLEKNSEITGILEKRFSSQRETYCNDRLVLTLLLQLKTAIQTGDLQRSKTLIYQGCPLDTPIPRTGHISPLPYSLISRQIAIAEWLLQNGASVLGVDPLSTDPIITAARYPHLTTILPTILQRFTDQGGNWEHYAFPLIAHTGRHGSEAGLKAIFTYLRTHTTTSPLSKELRTRPVSGDVAMRYPLHHSVYHSKYGVVRLLLENGAPVDSVDHLGTTPLALARTSKMVDLLIEFGASPAPLLTNCLASNLISLAQSATRALESLTLAFLQQSGLSSMKWLDTSLPVYHDFSDLGLRHGIFQSQCLLKHCHNGCSKIVNYLAGLPFGIGLGPLLQTGIEVCEVKPFPWHLYHPFTFSRISFIQKHYRVVCKHYGLRDVKIWANLQPDQGWSPLCRAASQNCAETMDNCLSLGADIEFEGCPLGSALMIASACGQLEAVKLLVRRNARVCYEGRAGRLSVFKVATSKTVKAWLLVGRFNDQQRIKNTVEHTSKETKSWSGFVQARANLHGYQHVRDEESRFDCAKRLKTYERMMRGRVAPYIDGLIFNRHLDRTLTPFSSDR